MTILFNSILARSCIVWFECLLKAPLQHLNHRFTSLGLGLPGGLPVALHSDRHLGIEVPVSKWVCGSVAALRFLKYVPIECSSSSTILELGLCFKTFIVIKKSTK